MKLDILAIGVHPDDVEMCIAGTLLKHIEMGYTVGIIDLTQGELGTRGTPELRLEEAATAAKMLGAQVRENLGMRDGFFTDSEENQLKIIRMIRKYRPEIVFANAIRDRHPDHGRSAELESRSCFLSGLRKVETELDGIKQEAWRPKAVYHYIQDYRIPPDFCVDVTPYHDKKMEIIKCYKSQFYDAQSEEPQSPISSKGFLDYLASVSRISGRPIGVEYGEAFTSAQPIRIENVLSLVEVN
jgi:bacillithiol biosynthesis deacetylase BshB1